MGRARRIFAAACLVSLFIHLGLMGTVGQWWTLPQEEVPFPIEASLNLPQPPARPPASARKPRAPAPEKPATPVPVPLPQSDESVGPAPSEASAEAPTAPVPEPPPAISPEPVPQTAEPEPLPTAAAPQDASVAGRIVRALPEKLVLVYKVLAGEGGLNLGQATYTWLARGDHYSLVSVAEATGLTSLFMSGRIVQTSEGRIGPAGLLPDQFWLAKNEKRQDTARFDWVQKLLILPKNSELLRPDTQDLLSFPFHLAMTVSEGDEGWILPVTNGRKLKGYRFAVLGRERAEVGGESVDTVHVQGNRAGDGSLDVWLAPSRHWLPVRIRTQDVKGKLMELDLASFSSGE